MEKQSMMSNLVGLVFHVATMGQASEPKKCMNSHQQGYSTRTYFAATFCNKKRLPRKHQVFIAKSGLFALTHRTEELLLPVYDTLLPVQPFVDKQFNIKVRVCRVMLMQLKPKLRPYKETMSALWNKQSRHKAEPPSSLASSSTEWSHQSSQVHTGQDSSGVTPSASQCSQQHYPPRSHIPSPK